jgi:ABC-type nickel/cobalt efflux system permease component RcnA
MAVLFFSFFDAVVLSLLPVYATSHGFAVGVAALMVTVVFASDVIFQRCPWAGWPTGSSARLHLVCGLVAMSIGIGLPWLLQMTWLLWPLLVVLGAVAGASIPWRWC